MILAYGTLESPEFMRQSRDFALLRAGGRQAGTGIGRPGVQPLRDARNARQPLWALGARSAGADGGHQQGKGI